MLCDFKEKREAGQKYVLLSPYYVLGIAQGASGVMLLLHKITITSLGGKNFCVHV